MIYLLRDARFQYIKIGFTDHHPLKRIRAIQNSLPFDLVPLGYGKGTRDDEKMLHLIFREHRVRGEWFKYSDAIVQHFKERKDFQTIKPS